MSIEYEPMYCPVCGNFYFSELQDGDDPENFQCLSCGWKYNLHQIAAPDEADEKNGKSLNEFKEWYDNKLAENPDYNYLEETIPDPAPHICPVCGKYQFKDIDSYDICPVCGWEDDGAEDHPHDAGANGLSFSDYQKSYHQKLRDDPNYHWKSLI